MPECMLIKTIDKIIFKLNVNRIHSHSNLAVANLWRSTKNGAMTLHVLL